MDSEVLRRTACRRFVAEFAAPDSRPLGDGNVAKAVHAGSCCVQRIEKTLMFMWLLLAEIVRRITEAQLASLELQTEEARTPTRQSD